jgi:ABC-type sugar transport system ATPase subunit
MQKILILNKKADLFMTPILKLENIQKSFPGVRALHNMQIELLKGELLAVCGENGAGKSTLMKVITGVYRADAGNIYLEGQRVTIKEPNDAYSKGIAIIFQETSLFKDLTVLENLFVGHEPMKKIGPFNRVDYDAMRKKAQEIFDFLGVEIDLDVIVDKLGVATKQMVEIAKAMTYGAKILILDEPTAALTNKEVRALFSTIARLKEQGISMIYISHRMEEIFELADRVTVIRDGEYVNTAKINEVNEAKLISWMVGREMSNIYPKEEIPLGDVIFEAKNISKKGLLDNISFSLRKNEILGVAGLAGAGRTELAECICGLMPHEEGEVILDGKLLSIAEYKDAVKEKLVYASEDRKKSGLVLAMSIMENTTMSILNSISKKSFINFKKERDITDQYMQELKVKAPTRDFVVENLSGGNQQKVLLAKALAAKPKVLILDEPTRGVDVGAKYEIYKIIGDLAASGVSIIMISSDMPELLGMSDRILVIKQGKLVWEVNRGPDMNQEKILEKAL